jgi:hypothetical protein
MTTFYGTVVGYKAYADARLWSYVAYSDPQITAALVRATAYLDGYTLPGFKVSGRSQTLQWPRYGVVDVEGLSVDSTVVPAEIENATYEGAYRELAKAGVLQPDVKPGGGVIRRVKTGSTEVEYQSNSATTTTFAGIDAALAPLLGGQSAYSGRSARA